MRKTALYIIPKQTITYDTNAAIFESTKDLATPYFTIKYPATKDKNIFGKTFFFFKKKQFKNN